MREHFLLLYLTQQALPERRLFQFRASPIYDLFAYFLPSLLAFNKLMWL